MKKFLVIVMCLCSAVAFARPPHGGHHGRHHHRGNDGVWLAAGITSIVANGISILNAVSSPRYVSPAPVVQTPVVVPHAVYPQVEYTPPQTVYPQSVGVPRIDIMNKEFQLFKRFLSPFR